MPVRDSDDGHAALSDIAIRLREGDARALGELYDAVGPRAFALARRVLGDAAAAEDAVHEAFTQLWERAPSLEPVGRIDSLIMTMVHRRAVDAVRRRRGTRVSLAESGLLAQIDERAEAALDEVVNAISEATLRARLQSVLSSMPDEQRLVVRGVYFESLTLREIAERHEIPLGTAKSRLRLAMARLGDAMRAEVQR
ncbi:MAG: sigma-70 family RNA polymerase sigma factor [Dehalococcoidia bacterium]